jgi:bacteriocin-like protein
MKRRKPEGFCTHRKENTMSNHAHDEQQPQELRQSLLSELETNQQAMSELNDEELEQVAGGGFLKKALVATTVYGLYKHANRSQGGAAASSQSSQGPSSGFSFSTPATVVPTNL